MSLTRANGERLQLELNRQRTGSLSGNFPGAHAGGYGSVTSSPSHIRAASSSIAPQKQDGQRTQTQSKADVARLVSAMLSVQGGRGKGEGGEDEEFHYGAAATPSSGMPPMSPRSPMAVNTHRYTSPGRSRSPAPGYMGQFASPSHSYASSVGSRISFGGNSVTALPDPYGLPQQTRSQPHPMTSSQRWPSTPDVASQDTAQWGMSTQALEREVADLRDEIDLWQEENEFLVDKLRSAEEIAQEAEQRTKELERQVASLGDLLNKKDTTLRQKEVELKTSKMKESRGTTDDEISAIRQEAEAAMERALESEQEMAVLRSSVSRMALSRDEVEEVVLKRCWLARYWGLAWRHNIHSDVAASKHEYWSRLAPLPLELVLATGQKSAYDAETDGKRKKSNKAQKGGEKRDRRHSPSTVGEMLGENVESLLAVERALKELSSLKLEEAVLLAMALQRRPALHRSATGDKGSPKSRVKRLGSGDLSKVMDAVELSSDEVEDVQFKQAWLTYIWRRAFTAEVEADIAEERLCYWSGRMAVKQLSTTDAVDVEKGLVEVRKLGVEEQLWLAARALDGSTSPSHGSSFKYEGVGSPK